MKNQLLFLGAAAGLLLQTAVLEASANPSTWVFYRLIGFTADGWVATRLERSVPSYYEGRSILSLEVRRNTDGCRVTNEVLRELHEIDAQADGNWKTSVVRQGTAPTLLTGLRPAVPSDWRSGYAINDEGLAITFGERTVTVLPHEQVGAWARMQGVETEGYAVRVSDVYEPFGVTGNTSMLFIEVETDMRDGDVDYGRFIIPVAHGKLAELLADESPQPAAIDKLRLLPGSC
jgi:hypothetical protein